MLLPALLLAQSATFAPPLIVTASRLPPLTSAIQFGTNSLDSAGSVAATAGNVIWLPPTCTVQAPAWRLPDNTSAESRPPAGSEKVATRAVAAVVAAASVAVASQSSLLPTSVPSRTTSIAGLAWAPRRPSAGPMARTR
jgi:hypothetical protein